MNQMIWLLIKVINVHFESRFMILISLHISSFLDDSDYMMDDIVRDRETKLRDNKEGMLNISARLSQTSIKENQLLKVNRDFISSLCKYVLIS